MAYKIRKLLAGFGVAATLFCFAASAQAVELIVNGNFETGDLSGWTTSGIPGSGSCPAGSSDWVVSSSGAATNCLDPGDPSEGTSAAYNMFDSGVPVTYWLRQPVTLPAGITAATLSWMDAIFDTHDPILLPRTFSINVRDATGTTVLATLYSYPSPGGDSASSGWISHTEDVTAALAPFSGQNVILEFSVEIPEPMTGPGGFGLDTVSLDVTGSVAQVPTLSEWSWMGLLSGLVLFGFAGIRRRQLQ